MNSVLGAMSTFGHFIFNQFVRFGGWVGRTIQENKSATWFALSVLGIFFSNYPWFFVASAFCALLVLTNSVRTVTNFIGKQFSTLITFIVKTMMGGHGIFFALLTSGGAMFAIGFWLNSQNVAVIGILMIVCALMLGVGKLSEKFKFFK